MAAINKQPEVTSLSSTLDYLVADVRQPDGKFKTRKITPGNLGVGTVAPGLGFTPENVANKSDDASFVANSVTLYPTQRAVRTYINTVTAGFSNHGEEQVREGWASEFFEQYAVGASPVLNEGIGWDGDGVGTGLSIVNRNIYTGKSENRLVISNGQYGRKLFFGDFWNRIQIGIMFRINGSASFTADGYVGLCNGTTNMVASATTNNFVGTRWSTDAGSWAFTAGTLVNYYRQATGTRFVTRRGTTTTDRGSGVGSDGRAFSTTEGYRSMLFLEFSRPLFATDATSVTYSVGMRSTDFNQVEMSMSKRGFMDVMQEPIVLALAQGITGSVVMGASAVLHSWAFDQSTGKLDTLNISWPFSDPTIEIAALAVRKLY